MIALVVEDNDENLELVTQLLEEEYQLVSARNGARGLELAYAYRPALILMDLSLPVVDGWEAIRCLRADQAFDRTAIIVLSAHAAPVDIVRAIDAGCDGYVTKPLDEEELFGAIARGLASRGRSA